MPTDIKLRATGIAKIKNAVLYEAPVSSGVTGSVTPLSYDGLKTNNKGGRHDRLYHYFPRSIEFDARFFRKPVTSICFSSSSPMALCA